MLESTVIDLDGESFQITQFTATKGVKFFRMISKYAGPLLGLMGSEKGDSSAVNVAIEALVEGAW